MTEAFDEFHGSLAYDAMKEALGKQYEDLFTLPEGETRIRFVAGPVLSQKMFYPAVTNADGQAEPKAMAVAIAQGSEAEAFLRRIQMVEREVLESLRNEGKFKLNERNLVFRLQKRYLFAIFVIDEDPNEILPGSFPKKIVEQLYEISTKRARDPRFFWYGPFFLWDALVTKEVDLSLGIQYGTKYTVIADPEFKYAGKIPATWQRGIPKSVDLVEKGFYTAEQMDAINAKKASVGGTLKDWLKTYVQPVSDVAQLNDFFERFPINLQGTVKVNTRDVPAFPDPERFLDRLNEKLHEALPVAEAKPVLPGQTQEAQEPVKPSSVSADVPDTGLEPDLPEEDVEIVWNVEDGTDE